jgi:hypothetical protein
MKLSSDQLAGETGKGQDQYAVTSDPSKSVPGTCQSIDWYAEGQARTVDVAGVRITVRFIGRKGRRGRIAIVAPAGAVFRAEART